MRIAIQTDCVPAQPLPGDALYLGERFCVRRFLRLAENFAEYARGAAVPVWLQTPIYVRENDFDPLAKKIEAVGGAFTGLHVGDIGLARRLNKRFPVAFHGAYYNREGLDLLRETLSINRLHLYPPRMDFMIEAARLLPVECVGHGLLPISATPRCLTRMYDGNCDDCERVREVRNGAEALWLRGNTLYATQPVVAYGLIGRFREMGLDTLVLEAFRQTPEQLAEQTAIYRGEAPPPDDRVSGLFLGSDRASLDDIPWRFRRRIPAGQ